MRLPFALLAFVLIGTFAASAKDTYMELPFDEPGRWTFVSDQVMGGVSTGQARVDRIDGALALRLTGTVSTANNGGFIQARADLEARLPPTTKGVVLNVRGNDQRYFVHLRTSGTALPWQYYQAPFEASTAWQEVRLPFSAFKPSGRMLRKTPRANTIRSLGIVAYGRPHQADVSVRFVGFYE